MPLGNSNFDYGGVKLPYQQFSAEGNAAQWAVDKFKSILGRTPTESELAQVVPIFVGADANKTDVLAGTQAVSAIKNTPSNLLADQNAELLKKAPEHFGTVDKQFQDLLGRAATDDEKKHFGSLLASGTVDPYQLQDFLKAQPEYTTKSDEAFRGKLSGQMQANDSRYFNEQIMPGIQSNFAKQGRSVDSSGFANALGQAGQQQNTQREQYLSQLSAAQYGNNQANAYGAYQQFANNNMAMQQASAVAPYARINQLADYGIQQNAYENYLRRYGKRGNAGMGAATGGLSGAAAGASLGPWGALAGGILGAGLGAYGQSQVGSY